jgi:hypothetical protein
MGEGDIDWVDLAQGRVKWRAVCECSNDGFHKMLGSSPNSCTTGGLWSSAQQHS